MITDETMHTLRQHRISALSFYASWKAGVGADVYAQETNSWTWYFAGRLGFESFNIDEARSDALMPKTLDLLRKALVPKMLLRLPDRSSTTIGLGWTLQVAEDARAAFQRTTTDPLPSGPQSLVDALASVRTTAPGQVDLHTADSAHLRLAQAEMGICPAVLDTLRYHACAEGRNDIPRLLVWPGAVFLLPDAHLPAEAWRPRACRFS